MFIAIESIANILLNRFNPFLNFHFLRHNVDENSRKAIRLRRVSAIRNRRPSAIHLSDFPLNGRKIEGDRTIARNGSGAWRSTRA